MTEYNEDKTIAELQAAPNIVSEDEFVIMRENATLKTNASKIASYIADGVPNPPSLPPFCQASLTNDFISEAASAIIPWGKAEGTEPDLWHPELPTRLTVPIGIKYVRLTATIWLQHPTGPGVQGLGVLASNPSTTGLPWCYRAASQWASGNTIMNIASGIIKTQPGDFFEINRDCTSPGQRKVLASPRTWFTMELLG